MNKSTDAELANDPSLRWNAYRKWEVLWSDEHRGLRRFHSYVVWDKPEVHVWLATVDGMEKLPMSVPANAVRRPTVMQEPERPTRMEKEGIVDTQRKGLETRSKR